MSIIGLFLIASAVAPGVLFPSNVSSFAPSSKPTPLPTVQVSCEPGDAGVSMHGDLAYKEVRHRDGSVTLESPDWKGPRTPFIAMRNVLAKSYPNLTFGDFVFHQSDTAAVVVGVDGSTKDRAAFYFNKHGDGWANTAIKACSRFLSKPLTRPDMRVRIAPPPLHPDAAQIYSKVTKALVEDRSYSRLYINPILAGPFNTDGPRDKLPLSVQKSIVDLLADFMPAEFINRKRTRAASPSNGSSVKDPGLIIDLGLIEEGGMEAYVKAGTYCGGLCGWGATYVLQEQNGEWLVAGTVGGSWTS